MYMVTWRTHPTAKAIYAKTAVDLDANGRAPWFVGYEEARRIAEQHANKYPTDLVEIHAFHPGGVDVVEAAPDPLIELRQRIIALAVEMGVWSKVEYIENYQVLLLEGEGHGDVSLKFERLM